MKKYPAIILAVLTVLIAAATDATSATDNVSNTTNVCEIIGTNYNCESWSSEQYPVIDLFGERDIPLFAANGNIWDAHVNKLAKSVLDSNETYMLKDGEKLDLGHGYTLEAKQINIQDNKVWLEFTQDGQYIADQIISVNTDDNKTWTVALDNVQGENNTVVMRVHINQFFVGVENNVVRIDGIWLIDYANARTLKIGDKIGNSTLEKIFSGEDSSNLGSLVFKKVPK